MSCRVILAAHQAVAGKGNRGDCCGWFRWRGPPAKLASGLGGDEGMAAGGRGQEVRRARDPPRAPAFPAQKSDAARGDVAIHVVTSAQENDAVTGRIGLVIFQLV